MLKRMGEKRGKSERERERMSQKKEEEIPNRKEPQSKKVRTIAVYVWCCCYRAKRRIKTALVLYLTK